MKTNKLLCIMLAIFMVISMMATFGIQASAGNVQSVQCPDCYEGYVCPIGGTSCHSHWDNGECTDDGDGHDMLLETCTTCNGTGMVPAVPQNECYLDLDSTTTDILDSKKLDQNYNLKVNDSVSKANEVVTKVKLTWEIKDINATRTDNKVWDTEDLCWKTESSSTIINQQGTAKFTLENYSSVKVDATVSFKAEGNFKGTASYDVKDGKVTIDTANGNSAYSKTNVPKAVINATITTASDDFNDKNATTTAAKYGVYTVTIGKVSTDTHKVTVSYYANATDEEGTLATIYVADGTAITRNGNTIQIGTYSYTNAKTTDAWWVGFNIVAPDTVTEDLDIVAVEFGF